MVPAARRRNALSGAAAVVTFALIVGAAWWLFLRGEPELRDQQVRWSLVDTRDHGRTLVLRARSSWRPCDWLRVAGPDESHAGEVRTGIVAYDASTLDADPDCRGWIDPVLTVALRRPLGARRVTGPGLVP